MNLHFFSDRRLLPGLCVDVEKSSCFCQELTPVPLGMLRQELRFRRRRLLPGQNVDVEKEFILVPGMNTLLLHLVSPLYP
jgi:hypothetical protein